MAKEQRQKRRKFSDEYKAETVRLIQSSGKSVGQMALELGIGETALRRWMAQAEVEAGRGPAGALTYRNGEGLLAGNDVPDAAGFALGILCVAQAAGIGTCAGGPAIDAESERDPRAEPLQLRQSAGSYGAA